MDERTGGAGDDTFNALAINPTTGAAATTLNALDVLNGGAGRDTLNLTATATNNNELVGSIQGIEVVNITGANSFADAEALEAVADAEAAVADAEAAEEAATAAADAALDARDQADDDEHAADVVLQAVLNSTGHNPEDLAVDAVSGIVGGDGSSADNVVAQAVIDAAGAAGATLATVIAAARVAYANFADAKSAATDAHTDAQNALTAAQAALTTAQQDLLTAQEALRSEIDASFFGGAEQLWLVGSASNAAVVTDVTTQTVGLRSMSSDVGAANATIEYAANVAAGTIALDNARGAINIVEDAANSTTNLRTLSISGSVAAEGTGSSAFAGTLALNQTGTDTVRTLNLNLSTAASVDIADITSVRTITSTGDANLRIEGATTALRTISTAGGNDTVDISTATNATTEVNASVSTGSGNDTITVTTSGTGTTTINAGIGNDTVRVNARELNAGDRFDGGAGTDTIRLGDYSGQLTAANYGVINSVLTGFETIRFDNNVVEVDASELSGFSTLRFHGKNINNDFNVVRNVADSQTIVNGAEASLTIVADGYEEATQTDPAVYDGSLNIIYSGAATSQKTLDIYAEHANVTVSAATSGDRAAIIWGDLKTLAVALNNTTNADVATFDAAAVVGTINRLATLEIDTSQGGVGSLGELTTLTLTGSGSATVTGGHSLATINASGLGGTLAVGANAGNITGGLTFTGDAAIEETISLGSGTDNITVASTYADMDTIIGFDSRKETSTGRSTTDVVGFGGATLDGAAVNQIAKMTVAGSSTTLALAFVQASAIAGDDQVFFHFNGDTYLFQDVGGSSDNTLDNTDLALKITGIHNFDTAWGVFA